MASTLSKNNLVKQAGETRSYIMDFSNLMASDEIISTHVGSTSELRGGGSSDLSFGIISIPIAGQIITIPISGGTKSHTYRIEVTITTSGGATLQGDGLLRISN